MKKLLITLGLLLVLSQITEAKSYIWDTSTGSVKEESEIKKEEYLENKALNEAYANDNKKLKYGDFVVMPSYIVEVSTLEKKGLIIDTDTFDGVFFIDTDSGEFIEVKGFKKEFLKEKDLVQATFDGIEFRMVWGKLYVSTKDLETKGILKDKSPKPKTFKLY